MYGYTQIHSQEITILCPPKQTGTEAVQISAQVPNHEDFDFKKSSPKYPLGYSPWAMQTPKGCVIPGYQNTLS